MQMHGFDGNFNPVMSTNHSHLPIPLDKALCDVIGSHSHSQSKLCRCFACISSSKSLSREEEFILKYGLLASNSNSTSSSSPTAVKENTYPLRVWLEENRDNPYPTKSEKLMLSVVTKMTLTQVSTWFANARRRLKKERRPDHDFVFHDIYPFSMYQPIIPQQTFFPGPIQKGIPHQAFALNHQPAFNLPVQRSSSLSIVQEYLANHKETLEALKQVSSRSFQDDSRHKSMQTNERTNPDRSDPVKKPAASLTTRSVNNSVPAVNTVESGHILKTSNEKLRKSIWSIVETANKSAVSK